MVVRGCRIHVSRAYQGFPIVLALGIARRGLPWRGRLDRGTERHRQVDVRQDDCGRRHPHLKPQYIKRDFDGTVRELLFAVAKNTLYDSWYKTEILAPLQLTMLLDNRVDELSGGELQRTAIAACLSKRADLYLLDEPSAYLDVEQRLAMAKAIRRRMENEETTAIVVEHDLVTTDYISDRTIVFSGTPSVEGSASSPTMMRTGMNDFLSRLDITFRRDSENGRPRANKRGSQLDRKQKDMGEYYYSEVK
jgi:ATP-binding cassette subfamily E protein 1